ncbi:hypothetical protein HOP54_00110 [Halomonas daqingensis]|uniref:hypothetical protein n=1 Tax=Billgrantia desiderata TaxID=52021 RepID=UPI001F1D1310|nr:hypothetical protein [Halomonas desiderata]MCE8027093.1 hypothetical protein [Halomonas desiderata]
MTIKNMNQAAALAFVMPFLFLLPGLALCHAKMWRTATLTFACIGISLFLASGQPLGAATLYLAVAASTHLASLALVLVLKAQ